MNRLVHASDLSQGLMNAVLASVGAVLEEILTSYPRLNFKSAFRDLLVEHCRRNPAAHILAWTDEVARTIAAHLPAAEFDALP
jgi:superfamily I DNA and RNA helicase